MTPQEKMKQIQALEKALEDAKKDLQKTKVEIGIGDMAMWNNQVYYVIKTPMFNNGATCAVRIGDGLANWINIDNGKRSPTIKFLKVTDRTPSYDLRLNTDWIEEKYCTVKG